MKSVKTGLVAISAIILSLACSTPPANNNAAQNQNAAPSVITLPVTNSNSGQGAVVLPSNSNAAPNVASSASPYNVDVVALYAKQCGTCHGADGKALIKGAPDFTDVAWQKKESLDDFVAAIKKGKAPKMPGFEKKLTDEEVKALAVYTRAFAGL